jgi:hypothetical protein
LDVDSLLHIIQISYGRGVVFQIDMIAEMQIVHRVVGYQERRLEAISFTMVISLTVVETGE